MFVSCVLLFHCRCVLNWFGDWSTGALYQVGKEFTSKIDLEKTNVSVPDLNYLTTPFVTLLFCIRCVPVNSLSMFIIFMSVLLLSQDTVAV